MLPIRRVTEPATNRLRGPIIHGHRDCDRQNDISTQASRSRHLRFRQILLRSHVRSRLQRSARLALAARGISLEEISTAIQRANSNTPTGTLDGKTRIFTVETRVLIFFGWYTFVAVVLYFVYGFKNSKLRRS